MRRRNVAAETPRQVMPPPELVSPGDGCTREMLTAAYDAWVAGLPKREHPPILLQRMRRLGPLPLHWSKMIDDLEAKRVQRAKRMHSNPSTRWFTR